MEKVIIKLEAELRFQCQVKLVEKRRREKIKEGFKTEEPHNYDDDYINQLDLAISVLKNYENENGGKNEASNGGKPM